MPTTVSLYIWPHASLCMPPSHTYTNLKDQEIFFLSSSTQGNKFSLLSICHSLETGASDGFALYFHFKAHSCSFLSQCFHYSE